MIDSKGRLQFDKPFTYKKTKSGKVLIYWNGKIITTLAGRKFKNFMDLEQTGDEYKIQLYLAKVTGNFKHGNEKNPSQP